MRLSHGGSMSYTKPCPKCGYTMRVIEDGSVTNDGIKTVTMICANCLHMEPHSYRLEKMELPELGWRRPDESL